MRPGPRMLITASHYIKLASCTAFARTFAPARRGVCILQVPLLPEREDMSRAEQLLLCIQTPSRVGRLDSRHRSLLHLRVLQSCRCLTSPAQPRTSRTNHISTVASSQVCIWLLHAWLTLNSGLGDRYACF